MVPDDGQLPARRLGRARKIGWPWWTTSGRRVLWEDAIEIAGCIPLLADTTARALGEVWYLGRKLKLRLSTVVPSNRVE